MQAMILAAGLGTRLRPYTLLRPKPLFPILNRPLLLLTIERLKKAGFSSIIINAHHLREQIRRTVKDILGVIVQEEEIQMGTGGGLRKALSLFTSEPVLIINGDIYHTIDYQNVIAHHSRSDTDVTMVMHDYPRFNKVQVDTDNNVLSFTENKLPDTRFLAFTGIHVINPSILETIEPDIFYNIIDCYQKLIAKDETIKALEVTGHYWTDIGTPADYLDLHEGLLTGTIQKYEELPELRSSFLISEQAALKNNVQLEDWVCIGNNVTVGDNISLSRVVIWDKVRIPEHASFSNKIIGR